MAGALIRDVGRAALIRQKDDAGLTALVAAGSLYRSTVPANRTWPFGRLDAFVSTPVDGACYAGAIVTFMAHCFAKPRYVDNDPQKPMLETAEDYAGRIADAMKLALHNHRIPVVGVTALVTVQSVRIDQDPDENTAYHAWMACRARVLAA